MKRIMTLARRATAIALGLLATASVLVLFLVPRLTGGAALTILSGSMTPTYPVGSVVVVRPVEPPDVHEGDVITYARPDGSFTTHRVTGVDEAESGERLFTTKGDANRGEDTEPVTTEALRGKVWFGVPYLGRVRDAVSSPTGLVSILVLVALALSWERLRSLARRVPRPRRPATTGAPDGPGTDNIQASATAGPSTEPPAASAASEPPALPGRTTSAAAPLRPSPVVTIPTVAPMSSRAPVDAGTSQQLLVLQLGVGWLERREVMDLLPLIRGHAVAIGHDSLTLAVVGAPTHLDSVEEMLEQYSVTHCGRSNVVTPIARRHRTSSASGPEVSRSTQEAH